jgi:hypothetical protein
MSWTFIGARSNDKAHFSKKAVNRFSKGPRTFAAAESLMARSVFSRSLAFNLAVVARHIGLALFEPEEPKWRRV